MPLRYWVPISLPWRFRVVAVRCKAACREGKRQHSWAYRQANGRAIKADVVDMACLANEVACWVSGGWRHAKSASITRHCNTPSATHNNLFKCYIVTLCMLHMCPCSQGSSHHTLWHTAPLMPCLSSPVTAPATHSRSCLSQKTSSSFSRDTSSGLYVTCAVLKE